MLKNFYFLFFFAANFLVANPHGHKIVHGNVEVATKKNNLHIVQKSKKAIIEWQNFSIDKNETTNFSLPTSKCSVLNRVVGQDISKISGQLKSNGKVYLINENGVIIAPSGKIVTSGFYASTLNLENDMYLNDTLKFYSRSDSSIINEGSIIAKDGDVFLISKTISNKGQIEAKEAANLIATEVLLIDKNMSSVVELSGFGSIDNSGLIKAAKTSIHANGDNIFSLAINHSGIIDVCSLSKNEANILLDAKNATAKINGKIKAVNALTKEGGKIHLFGKNLEIKKDAVIDSSDENGGGEILIGADFKGKNKAILNADRVFVEQNALINASANLNGDGGKVIVWGEKENSFYGTILAKGGEIDGKGGFVEISVKGNNLKYKGFVDTSRNGRFGDLLLDPSDINITNSTSDPAFPTSPGVYNPGPGEPNPCILDVLDLTGASGLASTNVTVSTSNGDGVSGGTGIITVSVPISWTAATSLTLEADASIAVNAAIGGASTIGDITLQTDTLTVGADIQTTGTLTIRPKTLSRDVYINAVGTVPGVLNILGTDLNHFIPGFTKISIGASSAGVSTGTGITYFFNSYTFNDPLELFGGTVYIQNVTIISYASTALPCVKLVSNTGYVRIYTSTITANDATAGLDGIVLICPNTNVTNANGCYLATATLRTSNRNISITGNGGPFNTNFGVFHENVSGVGNIQATGSGAISITGYGGNAASSNDGFFSNNSNITCNTGSITINGISNYSGAGVLLNLGIIQSTGSGPITINGTAGTNANNTHGIQLATDQILTTTGNIILTGISNSPSSSNTYGFETSAGVNALVQSYGSGAITIHGTGNAGSSSLHYGVNITAGSIITSLNGNIDITGDFAAGASAAGQVGFSHAGTISSTGSANISITGTGGPNTSSTPHGISIAGGRVNSSSTGTILLTGTCLSNNGSGIVFAGNATTITSTADVSLIGAATSLGAGPNYGVNLSISNILPIITVSGSANITINGTGAGGTGYGVFGSSGFAAPIFQTVSGNISLTGTASGGGTAVYISNSSISTTSGAITFTQAAPGSAGGITTTGGGTFTIGGASDSGNITFSADTMSIGCYLQSSGIVTLKPITTSRNINLNGSSGDLGLTTAMLAYLHSGFTKISIGLSSGGLATGTGTTSFTNSFTFIDPIEFFGGQISFGGAALTNTSGSLTIPSIKLVSNTSNIVMSGSSITANNVSLGDGIILTTPNTNISNTHGVNLTNTSFTTLNRDITISTYGGPFAGNRGFYYIGTGKIEATGSGAISITGNGGNSSGGNDGFYFTDATNYIKCNTGGITINGIANYASDGIAIVNGNIQTTGSGAIIINGTTGATINNGNGITSFGCSILSSTTGDISITGVTSSTSSSSTYGINLQNVSLIQSSGSGKITVHGTGVPGSSAIDYGISTSTSTTIASLNGDITITGDYAPGANLAQRALVHTGIISSTGAAKISLSGHALNSSVHGWGIQFSGRITSSSTGTVLLTGISDAANGFGIYFASGSSTYISSSADVSIIGSTTSVTASNIGVNMLIAANTNAINVTGSAGISINSAASGSSGIGVSLNSGFASPLLNAASGNISITGTGAGTGNAINITNANIATTLGAITLTQNTTAGGIGIVLSGGAYTIGGASTSGNITLNSDTVTIGSNLRSTGILSIQPISAAQNININTTGVGTLDLPASALALFVNGFSKISIGNSTSGTITIGASTSFSDPLELTSNTIAVANPLAVSTAADSITLISDLISVNGNISDSGGSGLLYFKTITASRSIGLGDSSVGDYKLSTAAFSYIQNSFSNVYIGTTQDHVINIDYGATPVTYNSPFTITGKDITLAASNTIAAGSGKNVTLQIGQGTLAGTLNLNSNISVSGGGVFSASGAAFNDAFNIGASVNPTMTITGGAGTNSLSKADGTNTWQISGANSGSINAVTNFSQISNLTGGSGNDTFTILDGGSVSGAIDGSLGTTNALDYHLYTTPVIVDLNAGTATGATGGVSNINYLITGTNANTLNGKNGTNCTFEFRVDPSAPSTITGGNAATNTLYGNNALNNNWQITAGDGGNVGNIAFTQIQNLTGGSGNDLFQIQDGTSITGIVDGGSGTTNTLDYHLFTSPVTVNLNTGAATAINGGAAGGVSNINYVIAGTALNTLTASATAANTFEFSTALTADSSVTGNASQIDTLIRSQGVANAWVLTGSKVGSVSLGGFSVGFTDITNITGVSGGTDTLTGPNGTQSWVIFSLGGGSVASTNFTNMYSLTGGTGNDTFQIQDTGSITGTINGAAGAINALDYHLFTNPVIVDLQAGTATNIVGGVSFINYVIAGTAANTLTASATAANIFEFSTPLTAPSTVTGNAGQIDTLIRSEGVANAWLLTGSKAGSVSLGNSVTFTNITNITGVSSGTDTLTGPNGAQSWVISSLGGGSIVSTNFTNMYSLIGGTGNDTFQIQDTGSITGTINGAAGATNALDYHLFTSSVTVNLNTGAATAINGGAAGGVSNINYVIAGTALNTLTASATAANTFEFSTALTADSSVTGNASQIDTLIRSQGVANAWVLTGSKVGSVSLGGFSVGFTDITNITGVSGGTDTLTGPNGTQSWVIFSLGEGSVASTNFTNMYSLTGGTGNDTFQIQDTGSITGTINGGAGATNTLDYHLFTNPVIVDLQAGTATNIVGGVSFINYVIAGTAANTLTASATAANIFEFSTPLTAPSTVTGNAGQIDTLIRSQGVANAWLLTGSKAGSVSLGSNVTFTNITNITGVSSGTDTLTGPNGAQSWVISSLGGGSIVSTNFTNMYSLIGGTGNDSFQIQDTGSITGTINGAAGATNALDYHLFTSSVTVNLDTGAATNTGGVSNINYIIAGAAANTLTASSTVDNTFEFSTPLTAPSTVTGNALRNDTLIRTEGVANAWALTSSKNGTVTNTGNAVIVFTDIGNIVGVLGGTDVLQGPAGDQTWYITAPGPGSGTLLATNFSNMYSLLGNTGNDTFQIQDGSSIAGNIDGNLGATNTLDYHLFTSPVIVNLNTGAATAINGGAAGGVSNINYVIAAAAANALTASSTAANTFEFSTALTAPSTVTGNSGQIDTLIRSQGVANAWVLTGSKVGSVSLGGFSIGFIDITNITGVSGGTDTLTGPNGTQSWVIFSLGGGSVASTNFTNMYSLTGGTGNDTFQIQDTGSITGTINGAAGVTNTLDYHLFTSPVSVDLQAGTAINTGGVSNINYVIAGPAANTLTGKNGTNCTFEFRVDPSAASNITGGNLATNTLYGNNALNNNWQLTGSAAGNVGNILFSKIQNLTGGSGDDSFTFTADALYGTLDGGTGDNTLTGPNSDTIWTITGPNSGTINPNGAGDTNFTNIQNLQGGTAADLFVFNDGINFSGTISGGTGYTTLDYYYWTTDLTVDVNLISNISAYIGGSAKNTLTDSGTVARLWKINALGDVDAYYNGALDPFIHFTGIDAIVGGSGNNTFLFTTACQFSTDPFAIDGGSGNSTLIGPNFPTQWNILGPNSGTINPNGAGPTSYIRIANLIGGTGNDTFTFSDGATLSGFVDGGDTSSINTLDYSLWTSPVIIDKTLQTASNLGEGYRNINRFIGNIFYIVNPTLVALSNFTSTQLQILLLPDNSICPFSPLYYFKYTFFEDIRIKNILFAKKTIQGSDKITGSIFYDVIKILPHGHFTTSRLKTLLLPNNLIRIFYPMFYFKYTFFEDLRIKNIIFDEKTLTSN